MRFAVLAAVVLLIVPGCVSKAPDAVTVPCGRDGEASALGDAKPVIATQRWAAPLPGGEPSFSSPLLVDVDRDGVLDIVVGNGEGHTDDAGGHSQSEAALTALSGRDGTELWRAATGKVDASAALADVTGDGVADLVVGQRTSMGIVRVDVADGAVAAAAPLGNWVHSPALADIDGDGTRDVLVVTGGDDRPSGGAGRPGHLLALDGASLAPKWNVTLVDEAYSSPAVAGSLVLHGLGGQLGKPGAFEARDLNDGTLAWRVSAATGVLASPAVADFDGDGQAEVVFAEWWGVVQAVNVANGTSAWSTRVDHLVWTSPAVAFLNGDACPDIVVSGYRTPDLQFERFDQPVNGKWSLAQGNGGVVAALNGPDGRDLWRADFGGTPGTPVTADVTGDGRAEVIVALAHGSSGYFGEAGGSLLVLNPGDGTTVARVELAAGAIGTPAVADLDGDGKPEVVVNTVSPGSVVVIGFDAAADPLVPGSWPRWRGNDAGTGEPVPAK